VAGGSADKSVEIVCVGFMAIPIAVGVLIGCCALSCIVFIICRNFRLQREVRKAQQRQQTGEYDMDDKC